MRTIKFIAFLLVFSFAISPTIQANNSPNEIRKSSKEYKELRSEISSLIQNPKLKENGIKYESVKVKFKINQNNEIDFLNIETANDYLHNFVKTRLEHQNLDLENLSTDQTYIVKFTFELQ